MSKIADGWLLTLINGQMIFCPDSVLVTDKEGNYVFDGDGVYMVMIVPQPNNQVQCQVMRPKRSPSRVAEIIIPKHGIMRKEKVLEDSFIYKTVIKDRSNIILPDGVNIPKDVNVQKNSHQG